MDKETAKEIIRENRYPSGYDIQDYLSDNKDTVLSLEDGTELLDDFDLWKEHSDLELEKTMDRNYWSSAGGYQIKHKNNIMVRELYQRLRDYFNNLPEPTEEEKQFIRELNAGYFPITSVHRDDLEGKGFDVKKISDGDMQNLAEKMANDYYEQLFWPSMEIIAGEILGFPKVKNKDIICPKCNSENIRYNIHESRFHCDECSLAWDDILYVLVEFPEDSAPFEEEGTGYPTWKSGDNGALYVSEEDYIRHTGKSPDRDKCYRAVCWPDSQKYMGTKGCEPIQDENGMRDFGTSAYWVPILLTEETAGRRMDKKKAPVCSECGGTDIDILSDEGVAVCNGCHLEWPYVED